MNSENAILSAVLMFLEKYASVKHLKLAPLFRELFLEILFTLKIQIFPLSSLINASEQFCDLLLNYYFLPGRETCQWVTMGGGKSAPQKMH